MKILAFLCLVALPGCFPLYYDEPEPFGPAVKNSDLVFVRTGDHRYYYVIDKYRGVCFFHARLYGRSHLEQMNCNDLPEYMNVRSKQLKVVPKGKQPPGKLNKTKKKIPDLLNKNESEAFQRAYVQHFCARKSKTPEDLAVILSRHGIDKDVYERGKLQFSSDKAQWTKLSKDANRACP